MYDLGIPSVGLILGFARLGSGGTRIASAITSNSIGVVFIMAGFDYCPKLLARTYT